MAVITTLYDPTAPSRAIPASQASARPTLSGLTGKVIGFIDNSKPNFSILADDLGSLLMEKYGVSRVIKTAKPASSVPAKDEVIARLASECDLVITGSGD